MIGRTISHYYIEEKLGQGGMGVVYRARDTRLNRVVALKMLLPELASDSTVHRRMATEARAASALNHPVIATVFDFERTPEYVYIVYEYVEGETLRQVMQKRSLDLRETLSIAVKVADALTAAHEAGIIHRDLKPENVMIGPGGRVKILDFGLAKLSPVLMGDSGIPTVSTKSGVMVGTINYMSPEQLEGEPVDRRTDVFSFGIMLYEMAAGRHPFLGKTPISTMGNILRDDPPRMASGTFQPPPELEQVIRKCLRKNRAERYQAFGELLVDLEEIHGHLKTGALPSPPPPPPVPEEVVRRRTARILLLLIQAGYLTMYGVALRYAESLAERLESSIPSSLATAVVIVSAMCGIAVRLYLIAAVGLDHPETGRKFRWLFPALLALDFLWAASPLLLSPKLGFLALACVAALAYLPFSQRTLIQSAYHGAGSGSSGISAPTGGRQQ